MQAIRGAKGEVPSGSGARGLNQKKPDALPSGTWMVRVSTRSAPRPLWMHTEESPCSVRPTVTSPCHTACMQPPATSSWDSLVPIPVPPPPAGDAGCTPLASPWAGGTGCERPNLPRSSPPSCSPQMLRVPCTTSPVPTTALNLHQPQMMWGAGADLQTGKSFRSRRKQGRSPLNPLLHLQLGAGSIYQLIPRERP